MVSWAAREIGRTRSEARTTGRMQPPGWLPTEKRTSLPRTSKLPGPGGRRTLPRARRPRGQAVLHDLPALHHEADPLEQRDVLERIARHRDDVRELPRLEGAHAVGPPQQVRGVNRSRLDRLRRGQPPLRHVRELL